MACDSVLVRAFSIVSSKSAEKASRFVIFVSLGTERLGRRDASKKGSEKLRWAKTRVLKNGHARVETSVLKTDMRVSKRAF